MRGMRGGERTCTYCGRRLRRGTQGSGVCRPCRVPRKPAPAATKDSRDYNREMGHLASIREGWDDQAKPGRGAGAVEVRDLRVIAT